MDRPLTERTLESIEPEEHMALVYGEDISSLSLEEPVRNSQGVETEFDRIIRGAKPLGTQASRAHANHDNILCRLHSCCFTSETICSSRCDCSVSVISIANDHETEFLNRINCIGP